MVLKQIIIAEPPKSCPVLFLCVSIYSLLLTMDICPSNLSLCPFPIPKPWSLFLHIYLTDVTTPLIVTPHYVTMHKISPNLSDVFLASHLAVSM